MYNILYCIVQKVQKNKISFYDNTSNVSALANILKVEFSSYFSTFGKLIPYDTLNELYI